MLDYIKQQLSLNISKEEIKKSLIVNGWEVSDIEEGFNAVTSSPSPVSPIPPITPLSTDIHPVSNFINPVINPGKEPQTFVNNQKKSKPWGKIFLFLLIVILVGAGWFAFKYFYNSKIDNSVKVSLENGEEKQAECIDLVKTGDPSKNLDIVFVPDNIKDLEKFQSDLSNHINTILSAEPFKSKKDQINFYFLKTSENFGDYTTAGMSGEPPYEKINPLTKKCGGADEIIMMLDKNNSYGAAMPGGHMAISSIDDLYKTLHEFGHSFGGLYDTYMGIIPFNGDSNTSGDQSYMYPNVDSAGCSKWCESKISSYQTACTKIINEQQCRQYKRSQVEISGEKKWSCDDPATCCVWLPEPDPYFKTQCVNLRDDKNIGLNCVANSGCYYGAFGKNVWRSVQGTQTGDFSKTNSVMNDDTRFVKNFGSVEIKSMDKIFQCLYPQSCNNYDTQGCKDLSLKYLAFQKRDKGTPSCQ